MSNGMSFSIYVCRFLNRLTLCSIVFSTRRLTLDIIEAGLAQANIRSVRFDGKVPHTQRQPVLAQFRSDPSVRIMLPT
jgi:SNF2 family DNA or RNA helicase